MKFEEIPVASALGAILAHTHRVGDRGMLKKGHLVTADDVRALAASGAMRVSVARLEPDDVGEDEAAMRVAEAIAGRGLTIAPAFTGRANLFAATRGVLVIAREPIDVLNAMDEAITVATVAPNSVLEASAMAATVKIIPFAVSAALVARAVSLAERPLLSLAPFTRKRAGLVLTELPGVHEGQGARAAENQRLRMAYLGGELVRVVSTAHETPAVADAIASMLASEHELELDLVLVLGASAIVDRKDVVPSAIEAIGGVVEHLGMPVDPGNLLLVGRHGTTPIIGVPGCARTLKRSGFDWVLERLAADLPVTRAEITRLGVGGLLSESGSTRAAASPRAPARVVGIVLAAADAKRLLTPVDGIAVVARVVDALAASEVAEILVVVGEDAPAVRAALGDRRVRFVENTFFSEGLGASIRVGFEALGDDVDGALLALGDMPWVRAEHIDALVLAFDPKGASTICVPVHNRKRGHPVLWSRRHFDELRRLAGDTGARALLERHADRVLSVPVDDPGVHVDLA